VLKKIGAALAAPIFFLNWLLGLLLETNERTVREVECAGHKCYVAVECKVACESHCGDIVVRLKALHDAIIVYVLVGCGKRCKRSCKQTNESESSY
jgi:hypothetical protein